VIPPGSQIVGEAWPAIMVSGSNYQNINSPYVGVQVGSPGQTGDVEISGIIFTTQGPGQCVFHLLTWDVE
jgi:glucan 1,3-beta-glucosidase